MLPSLATRGRAHTVYHRVVTALLGSFEAGDVLVADRFYCSFMMIALLLGRGVDACVRLHPRRHVDFRRGKQVGYA